MCAKLALVCRRKRMCARKGEGGGVIQHDRDGSTALGSLELLMRPPSSLFLSLSLYAFSSPFFFFLPPLFPFPLSPLSSNLSLGLTPLPCLRVHSSLDPRLRDEQLVPRSFHSHSRIFIPTNNRNAVIAQLRELVSPPALYFFLLATAKRAFPRFPSRN